MRVDVTLDRCVLLDADDPPLLLAAVGVLLGVVFALNDGVAAGLISDILDAPASLDATDVCAGVRVVLEVRDGRRSSAPD